MNCMKCGCDIGDKGVFCGECLAEMENYPIKPGTVVHLPRRRHEPAPKKSQIRRKAQPTPEEQVKHLKKVARGLLFSLIIAVMLLAVTGYFAAAHLLESEVTFLPGQNYSAMDATESLEE